LRPQPRGFAVGDGGVSVGVGGVGVGGVGGGGGGSDGGARETEVSMPSIRWSAPPVGSSPALVEYRSTGKCALFSR